MAVHPVFGRFERSNTNSNGARGKVRIVGMVATVVVMCPCGSPEPMILPVVAGQYGRAQCSACDSIIRAESITYYEPKLPKPEDNGQIDPEKIESPKLTVICEVTRATIERPNPQIII